MTVYPDGSMSSVGRSKAVAGVNLKYAKGYNEDKWVENKGFKVDSGFPKTGFKGASFSLISSAEDQSKYSCDLASPDRDNSKVTLSGTAAKNVGKNCTITYLSTKRSEFIEGGMPVINLLYDSGDGKPVQIDSFTISLPTKWALVQGFEAYSPGLNLGYAGSYPALDTCRKLIEGSNAVATNNAQGALVNSTYSAWRKRYLYTLDEFTNTPLVSKFEEGTAETASTATSLVAQGYFSRDVDTTFTGEWGALINYKSSQFTTYGYFWTAQIWNTEKNAVAVVSTLDGYIAWNEARYTNDLNVCRGDNL